MSSLIDRLRLLGKEKTETYDQSTDSLEIISESFITVEATNLLIDALEAEKEKIMSDALLITQQDNREKINYEDMILALQKNGFEVELLDNN